MTRSIRTYNDQADGGGSQTTVGGFQIGAHAPDRDLEFTATTPTSWCVYEDSANWCEETCLEDDMWDDDCSGSEFKPRQPRTVTPSGNESPPGGPRGWDDNTPSKPAGGKWEGGQ